MAHRTKAQLQLMIQELQQELINEAQEKFRLMDQINDLENDRIYMMGRFKILKERLEQAQATLTLNRKCRIKD